MDKKSTNFSILFALLIATPLLAGELKLATREDWQSWKIPQGALEFDDEGSIRLAWIRRNINAVADADQFSHLVDKKEVFGSVRHAPSSPQTAANIMDQDPTTWWQPSTEDELEDWWIDLDLGRPVLARKLRLIFPDTLEVVPLRNFNVYISSGLDTRYGVTYDLVATTSEPNRERVFEVDLRRIESGEATGDFLVTQDTLDYALIHNVRIIATEKHQGAALAEIEVDALGDNIALGTVQRGGSIRAGRSLDKIATIFDGDVNTKWRIAVGGDQAKEGNLRTYVEDGDWFEWDLGATYWIDQLNHFDLTVEEGTRGAWSNGAKLFQLTTSDGTPASGLTTERLRSNLDYQVLSDVFNDITPFQQSYHFQFLPRKVRYIFYFRTGIPQRLQIRQSVFEYMLFGEGHVAGTEMESDFIDLGSTKSIRKLAWDADLPPDTRIEIRSQTGNTFEIEKKFFHSNGTELDSARYHKLPKRSRGEIREIKRKGPDWSGWSPVYAFPEERFLSPTPRQFVQLQVGLSNDDPQVTPLLRSITLHFDDPLIGGGVRARILPREVLLDSLQRFTYLLQPVSASADQGFDEVYIQVPAPAEEISLRIGGQSVVPQTVEMIGDSLHILLPQRVYRDSVEVQFHTLVKDNATLFNAWTGDSQQGIRQGVQPLEPRSMIVYVPEIAVGGDLIRNLEIIPGAFTPNGDGINETARIQFTVVKVEDDPEVTIYDLAGSPMRVLDRNTKGYSWDGRDSGGKRVPPGIYICQVKLAVDIGDRIAYRTINVVY